MSCSRLSGGGMSSMSSCRLRGQRHGTALLVRVVGLAVALFDKADVALGRRCAVVVVVDRGAGGAHCACYANSSSCVREYVYRRWHFGGWVFGFGRLDEWLAGIC